MIRLLAQVDSLQGSSEQIQFLLASATVGNALQMASKLISREGIIKTFLKLAFEKLNIYFYLYNQIRKDFAENALGKGEWSRKTRTNVSLSLCASNFAV